MIKLHIKFVHLEFLLQNNVLINCIFKTSFNNKQHTLTLQGV